MSKPEKPIQSIESDWMQDIEVGNFQSNPEALQRLKGKMLVDQALKKSHPVSLRIPDADIEAIQLKAAKVGIPYQTLIKSVIHQFATSQLDS